MCLKERRLVGRDSPEEVPSQGLNVGMDCVSAEATEASSNQERSITSLTASTRGARVSSAACDHLAWANPLHLL